MELDMAKCFKFELSSPGIIKEVSCDQKII